MFVDSPRRSMIIGNIATLATPFSAFAVTALRTKSVRPRPSRLGAEFFWFDSSLVDLSDPPPRIAIPLKIFGETDPELWEGDAKLSQGF